MGHVMRCMALADDLKLEGVDCIFLCRPSGLGSLADKITNAGFKLLLIPDTSFHKTNANYLESTWSTEDQKGDAIACLKLLQNEQVADWLVVDHYGLDEKWETQIQKVASRILVIDDLANRRHSCNLLLDQSRASETDECYKELIGKDCELLLGSKYALLRKDFASNDDLPLVENRVEIPRLLVMFGGSDPQNITLQVVKVIAKVGWSHGVDVVVGPLYQNLNVLSNAIAEMSNVKLHVNLEHVAKLMRSAGFAVGSPGVSSWERCSVGLPSLVISQSVNQELIGERLGVLGAHCYLGRASDVSDFDLISALELWKNNKFGRESMAKIAKTMCDGKGVKRVVRRLLQHVILIRKVNLKDADLLFLWRNDERTRRCSFDKKPLNFENHINWLSKAINDPYSRLLMAFKVDGSEPVACIRFDINEKIAKVSIYTDPNQQGFGFGQPAFYAAVNWLEKETPDIVKIQADVLETNEISKNFFLSVKFQPVLVRFELDRNLTANL